MAAIAEDTGIEVEALGGLRGCVRPVMPGEPPDDQANVDKVLAELAGRRGPGRTPGQVRDRRRGHVARWQRGERGGDGRGMDSRGAAGERRLWVRPGVRPI